MKKNTMATNVENNGQSPDEPDDMNIMDILFQFIPFYGQGNSSNDSTVRAALSSLAIEDIDTRDSSGNTLLLLACMYRCEDLVRIMLNKGADPNAVNTAGACCLHFACYGETASLIIAKGLLQNGANPEVQETSYGCTPLHYCASNGNVELCKLLLSHGAVVNTLDYYNYTCIDYARQAGMMEACAYLQQRLDKTAMRFGSVGGSSHYGGGSDFSVASPFASEAYGSTDWTPHIDPGSGSVYYICTSTGETLWEYDWKLKMQSSQPASQSSHYPHTAGTSAHSGNSALKAKSSTEMSASELTEATKATLTSFMKKYDQSRVSEVDSLALLYAGKEARLLKELCTRYGASESEEMAHFQANLKLSATRSGVADPSSAKPFWQGLSISTDAQAATAGSEAQKHSTGLPPMTPHAGRGIDPAAVAAALADERARFEAQLTLEMQEFQLAVHAKDLEVHRITQELSGAKSEKDALQVECSSVQGQFSAMQSSGGEELRKLEEELSRVQVLIAAVQLDLNDTRQECSIKTDKISSVENMITSLTSSAEDRVARERALAEERERISREREERHRSDCLMLVESMQLFEERSRADLDKLKEDLKKKEEARVAMHEEVNKTKEAEIAALTVDLEQRKQLFTEAMEKAKSEALANRRSAEDAVRRMSAAESRQRHLEPEVLEARTIQQYNAQLHKDLGREQLARKRLHNEMEDLKGKIRIFVRFRPMSSQDIASGSSEASFRDGKLSAVVRSSDGGKKVFDFDQVFGGLEANSQAEIFKDAKPLLTSVLDGFNVCVFAFGQTGGGKTYTMIGGLPLESCLRGNGDFEESAGIIPRAVSELFKLIQDRNAQVKATVEVQMLQVYLDQVQDLLAVKASKTKGKASGSEEKLKITLAEHSSTGLVHVEGAESVAATCPSDVIDIFARGALNRTTAATELNAESSRSHLVCSLVVKLVNRRSNATTFGKLTLVDLAGSERLDKSGAAGEALKESQSINQSLLALGDVVSALTSNQPHVPYRNHPLTMLMSDSIGGNAKTLMIINASPADTHLQETISSLNFAVRCKDVGTAAGPAVQAAQLNNLKKELAKLKKAGGGGGGGARAGLGRPG